MNPKKIIWKEEPDAVYLEKHVGYVNDRVLFIITRNTKGRMFSLTGYGQSIIRYGHIDSSENTEELKKIAQRTFGNELTKYFEPEDFLSQHSV